MSSDRELTYAHVGATDDERTLTIGSGPAPWQATTSTLGEWGVKTRSGFAAPRTGRPGPTGLRSLTRSSPGKWRPVFPALLIAQRFHRRRCLRAFGGGE
jgi:hypothetical protein